MGRPPLYPHRFWAQLDTETKEALDEYARARSLTRAEALRRLLRRGLGLKNDKNS